MAVCSTEPSQQSTPACHTDTRHRAQIPPTRSEPGASGFYGRAQVQNHFWELTQGFSPGASCSYGSHEYHLITSITINAFETLLPRQGKAVNTQGWASWRINSPGTCSAAVFHTHERLSREGRDRARPAPEETDFGSGGEHSATWCRWGYDMRWIWLP